MPRRLIYFGILFIALTGFRSLSQNPVYRNYTVDDGLPSNEVYNIFEDSLGYMWFATDHGISRFDGYEFKNYSTKDGLTHNTIFGFFEDQHHRIWMRAFNSTICYMENGKIYPYKHNQILQKFLGRHFIQTFAIDSVGDLWFMSILSPYGLYRQDHRTGEICKIPVKAGCNAFIRELGDNVFIAGVDFSDTIHPPLSTGAVYENDTWMFHVALPRNYLNSGIIRAARKEKKHYLFSCDGYLIEIKHTGVTKQYSPAGYHTSITHLYTDNRKNVWITGRGLYRYGTDTTQAFFSDIPTNSIRQDQRGSYWMATVNKGVFIIPSMEVTTLNRQNMAIPYLLGRYKNKILTMTQVNQLLSFSLQGQKADSFRTILSLRPVNMATHDISIDTVHEELILGSRLYKTNTLRNNGLNYYKALLLGNTTRSAFCFGDYYYASGNLGWSIVDRKGRSIHVSWMNGFKKFCSAICRDSSGTLWIGSTEGLYTFRKGRTEAFHPSDSSFRQNITSIKCMPDGLVAVSTRGHGILLIDGQRIYRILSGNGLSTDLCGRLTVDGNILWVCTNMGLNKITIHRTPEGLKSEVIRLKTEHGLPSNLIYDAIRYQDLLVLCTGKGLAWFDVEKFRLNDYAPPVRIEAVYANKRLLEKEASLNYKETNLSFGFTGLLYNSAGKISYRYKLDGYEPDWNYTTERSVRYFNLPAGHYSFIVEAMNENGAWSQRPARYEFFIPLHFTKTWWFIALLILLGITALWLVIHFYLKQRRVRERMNITMLMAELKTLRSQMKPHFVFNSLSSIQHFILDSDPESAHLYLSRFSKLMRQILDNTSKDSISLAGETEMLELYLSLEKLRFGEEFEYAIEIDEGLDPEQCEIPPMLIQPYLENAIWHGLLPKKREAKLWLRFYPEGETTLVCEVEDNGIGRRAAEEKKKSGHRSTGMKNIEERIGILNHMQDKAIRVTVSDLYDAFGKALGTKVILKFSNTLTPTPNL